MEVLRLSLRRYRFFPEFGARLPINSSAGCGTRRPSGGPERMSFRCAARVPDRSGLGAACPAVVRRLRYLRRAIICFHVPKFSHPEFPYPSAVACGLVLRPYHEVLFVKRFHAEKPETRKPLHKIYDRASLYRSLLPCILARDARAERSVPA